MRACLGAEGPPSFHLLRDPRVVVSNMTGTLHFSFPLSLLQYFSSMLQSVSLSLSLFLPSVDIVSHSFNFSPVACLIASDLPSFMRFSCRADLSLSIFAQLSPAQSSKQTCLSVLSSAFCRLLSLIAAVTRFFFHLQAALLLWKTNFLLAASVSAVSPSSRYLPACQRSPTPHPLFFFSRLFLLIFPPSFSFLHFLSLSHITSKEFSLSPDPFTSD